MQKFFYKIDSLQKLLKEHGDSNLFLITGKKSYATSGAKLMLKTSLRNCNITHFDKVIPNPDIDVVKLAVDAYRCSRSSLILAVGGGSVMDVAKATRTLAAQNTPLEEVVISNRVEKAPNGLLIAVPTTAGSGAESTHFAAIYINQRKYSLSHKQALPDVVILDPRLTYSLPPEITAISGMDAIAQAIESYWSTQSTALSRRFSHEALQKLLPNIEKAVLEPNPEVRLAMLEGANLAGRAINIAKTTACHALSYGFTALYGVSHGQAVSFTLPSFIAFNADITTENCQDLRGAEFVHARMAELYKLLGAKDGSSAKRQIEKLIDLVGLSRKFSLADASGTTTVLIDSIDPDRLKNNPRKVSKRDAQAIFELILAN